MAEILSIATAVPQFCHQQKDILLFMQEAYQLNDTDKRKLAFLYNRSEIRTRYSVVPDYSNVEERTFIPDNIQDPFPDIDQRMHMYQQHALPLAKDAITQCLAGKCAAADITHLITVSCTGMSAPGLDLELVEAFGLDPNTFRTSVNFMGCYAAIHAMKIADMICNGTPGAKVMIVCVELCTLHFQKEFNLDSAASSLLFADGAAAILMSANSGSKNTLKLKGFYSQVDFKGKNDMSWKLSSKGFLMTLSSYVPQLIQADIAALVERALEQHNLPLQEISHWCIHPGGKAILEAIQRKLELKDEEIQCARSVLADYGNMSSATILFVLKKMMDALASSEEKANIFGVAFGPGLTMESFIAVKE
ncbi:MAG: type III polyketide synthase [Chitinophagaceae bacterium]